MGNLSVQNHLFINTSPFLPQHLHSLQLLRLGHPYGLLAALLIPWQSQYVGRSYGLLAVRLHNDDGYHPRTLPVLPAAVLMILVPRLACLRELLQGKRPLAYGVHKDVCHGLVEDAQPVHFESVAGNLVALHTLILDFHFKDNTFLFDYQRNGFKNFAFPS